MIAVTSPDDPRVADYRLLRTPHALARRGLFAAEGRLVVARLIQTPGIRTRSVLVSEAAWAAMADVLGTASNDAVVYVVAQSLLDDLSGFNMHRGAVALAKRPELPWLEPGAAVQRRLVLDGVTNPDNIGSLFRTAAAFGVDQVVLGPGCGDPWYRKAVRTSMGAVFAVPMARARDWPGDLERLAGAGVGLVALTPAADAVPLGSVAVSRAPVALVVGNEGTGLTAGVLAVASHRVRIEMPGTGRGADSLNVTTAAAIAMHHFWKT